MAGIVIIIISVLIIIGLRVYWLFWKRLQNNNGSTGFDTKNSKKRPIHRKNLVCAFTERFSSKFFVGIQLLSSVRSETSGFLMFSGDIEKDQWHEMGYIWHKKYLPNIRVNFIEDP